MEKTAIEWLLEQIKSKAVNLPTNTKENRMAKGIYVDCLMMAKQAKEMEEKEHQETFKQSRLAKIFEKDMPPVWESWEQYYNKKFKNKKD